MLKLQLNKLINNNKITHCKLIYLSNYLPNLVNILSILNLLKKKPVGIVETLYNNNQVNYSQATKHCLVISSYQTNNYNQIVLRLHLKIKVLNRFRAYANIK